MDKNDSISANLWAILGEEVAKQTPSERAQTITSSGLPYFKVPRSMASETMPCCPTMKPCRVHSKYTEGVANGHTK